ncbi:MAG: T9SS type A sorting domain-containing protein [Cyclobacteriaceae bacterium]|jgi:hypothetical protein|nr:T9SS type A sorting domain-containing protein [Cyclobacteriaceae bacterium]
MKKTGLLMLAVFFAGLAFGQLEFTDSPPSVQVSVSEVVRLPIVLKNTSEKAQIVTFRLTGELGSTQRGYFCLDKNCFEQANREFTRKLEAGEQLAEVTFVLESGLMASHHTLRFEADTKGGAGAEYAVNVWVEEKKGRSFVFQTKDISLHDIYPSPITDVGFLDYRLQNESVKAKITIQNILGQRMGDYDLPYGENKVKISAEDLAAGVYFFTLYLNNQGVLTRKILVRK